MQCRVIIHILSIAVEKKGKKSLLKSTNIYIYIYMLYIFILYVLKLYIYIIYIIYIYNIYNNIYILIYIYISPLFLIVSPYFNLTR